MSRHASTPAARFALALCSLASAIHLDELEHAALSADYPDYSLDRRVKDLEVGLMDWENQHGNDIGELRDDTEKGLEDMLKKLQQEVEDRKEAQAKVETELKHKNDLILTLLDRMKGNDNRVQQPDERVQDMSTELNKLSDGEESGRGAVVQKLGELEKKIDQDRAEKALKEAIASQDLSALRLAIQQARNLDLHVSNAEAILKTRELTKEALAAKDIAKLEAALAAAKEAGLGQDELQKVKNAINAIKEEAARQKRAAAESMRQAAQDGNATRLRNLLEDFPELKDEGNYRKRETSAFMAAWHGHVGALKVLTEARADLNKADHNGATPAYIASQEGRIEALKALVQAKADVNKAAHDGAMPSVIASKNGQADALKVLVQAKADLTKAVWDGRTAASLAVEGGRVDVLEVLLSAGVVKKRWRGGYSE